MVACGLLASCTQNLTVSSPDGSIKLALGVEAGRLNYSVTVDSSAFILPSPLGLVSERAVLDRDFKVAGISHSAFSQTWTSPWGEN